MFEFEDSKFIPALNYIIEDQLSNKLPHDSFIWVKEPPIIEDSPISFSSGISNRTKPSWATKKNRSSSENPNLKSVDDAISLTNKPGSRLIIFVIGGMTLSEIRIIYKISKDLNREILIGSTNTINPENFIDILKDLHDSNPPKRKNPEKTSSNESLPTRGNSKKNILQNETKPFISQRTNSVAKIKVQKDFTTSSAKNNWWFSKKS